MQLLCHGMKRNCKQAHNEKIASLESERNAKASEIYADRSLTQSQKQGELEVLYRDYRNKINSEESSLMMI